MAALIDLLKTSHVGRLGTIGPDGCTMMKPLDFAFTGQRLYFHTARPGEKMEDIKPHKPGPPAARAFGPEK
jgi:nitroimidazol reductase NimA-like FMN-containing flavoprotein (pyridoxamine 5'-phosphate oxidase superfamily)